MNTPCSFNSAFEKCLQSIHTDTDKSEVVGIFTFPSDFPGFQGHFPGQPLLPAVAQLAAVRWLFTQAQSKKTALKLKKVEKAKFKQMIGPEEEILIRVQSTTENKDRTYQLTFSIENEKGPAASGIISCFN